MFDMLTTTFENAGSAIKSKLFGEFASAFYLVIVLPAIKWLIGLFRSDAKRKEARRDLEALRLLHDLEGRFGAEDPERGEKFQARYRELLARSDDMRRVMPELFADLPEATPPPGDGRFDGVFLVLDVIMDAVSWLIEWGFVLVGPALFVFIALTGTTTTAEMVLFLLASAIGAFIAMVYVHEWVFMNIDYLLFQAIFMLVGGFLAVLAGFAITGFVAGLVEGAFEIDIPGI